MRACGANIYTGLFRVTNIRFSKCSGVSFGVKTQPCGIRLPWLKPYSRQRPVAVLLTVYRTLRKSNILHSHKPVYIFAPHAVFCFGVPSDTCVYRIFALWFLCLFLYLNIEIYYFLFAIFLFFILYSNSLFLKYFLILYFNIFHFRM